MLKRIIDMFIRAKEKGVAGLLILVVVACVVTVGGLVSVKYWGHDNEAEEISEEVLNNIVETGLELPPDSVNIDLSPSSPEK